MIGKGWRTCRLERNRRVRKETRSEYEPGQDQEQEGDPTEPGKKAKDRTQQVVTNVPFASLVGQWNTVWLRDSK